MGRVCFEVGATYRNRSGFYKVLSVQGDKMRVSYQNTGTEATLSVDIQATIVANIRQGESAKHAVGPIETDRKTFFQYVDVCRQDYRFGHDLRLYTAIISKHRSGATFDSLLSDGDFHSAIWQTLSAWNMDQRGAKLVSPDNLMTSIMAHRAGLASLHPHRLDSLGAADARAVVLPILQRLFLGLQVTESKRRIVGVSKALHFLLPDLVIPIDGTYTLPYFYGYNKYDSTPEGEFATFTDIFHESCRITNKLNLSALDVDGERWNTSVPKLIDNAIIGLFKYFERSSK